jgi:hypothetical protein
MPSEALTRFLEEVSRNEERGLPSNPGLALEVAGHILDLTERQKGHPVHQDQSMEQHPTTA